MLVPDWLARVLTMEQEWVLRDNGWDDLGAALEEALRRSRELRQLWNSRNDSDWQAVDVSVFARIFWDQAIKALGIDIEMHDLRRAGAPYRIPARSRGPPRGFVRRGGDVLAGMGDGAGRGCVSSGDR